MIIHFEFVITNVCYLIVEISFLQCYEYRYCHLPMGWKNSIYTNFENLMSLILENMPCFNYMDDVYLVTTLFIRKMQMLNYTIIYKLSFVRGVCIYFFEHLGDYYWNIFSSFFMKSFRNLKYLFKKEKMLLLPRFELKTWLVRILTTTPKPIIQMI